MSSTYIVADIGISHNGSLTIAKQLIGQAKLCGVDAVKFQLFKNFPDLTQYELSESEIAECFTYAKQLSLDAFATPFDKPSIEFLSDYQTTWKIPSGFATNRDYIGMIIDQSPEHLILSTGMCNIHEVIESVGYIKTAWRDYCHEKFTVLQCTTDYPADIDTINLNVLYQYAGRQYGLSLHTPNIYIPAAAVAMGAKVIEVHITTDRTQPGGDHAASYDATLLKEMVIGVRHVERALGDGVKRPSEEEKLVVEEIRSKMEKSFNCIPEEAT